MPSVPIRPLLAMSVIALAVPSWAASPADSEFERLSAQYLDDIPALSPVNATLIGDHRADDRLDDASAAARDAQRTVLENYRSALASIDRSQLSRANQVDAALLGNDIDASLFALDTLEEWAWNPLVYVNTAGSSIYGLLARDFAPLETRLMNAAARLEQLPRYLRQARESLQPRRVPKVHAETAVRQNRGIVAIIETMILPAMGGLAGADRIRLDAAIETARQAVEEHQVWLQESLLPRANGDFRLGAERFDQKLRYTLNSSLSRKEIVARAESEYEAVRGRMYEIAKTVYAEQHPYTAFPDIPDEAYKQAIIRAALESAYAQLPPRDGIVELARQQLAMASDFVVERDIVTMPDDPVEVIVMPEFQRGVSFAYLDPPGPLDEGQSAFYAVAPLPADWNEAQINSFLREYNLYSMQSLTIHEGVPGHYLQLALSNRYPSTLRGVLYSGPFVEGWAVYAERVMADEGYLGGDPLMRLINLKWYLRAITNAIIDSAIHVDGMSEEAAIRLMIEGGFQEEREAAGKWVRAQLTSTQLSTYFVGYQEHAEMRDTVEARWGDDFTLRRYHDQALSYGSPPVRFVRALILGEPIPGTE